jgi:hypothetical protein
MHEMPQFAVRYELSSPINGDQAVGKKGNSYGCISRSDIKESGATSNYKTEEEKSG